MSEFAKLMPTMISSALALILDVDEKSRASS
jgi:hypothetical protein